MDRTLRSTLSLFDLSVTIVPFDTTLEAEAFGCAVDWDSGNPGVVAGCIENDDDIFQLPIADITSLGRIPEVLDGINRLVNNLPEKSIIGGVSGPGVLSSTLAAETLSPANREEAFLTAGDAITELARAYLEAGVDAVAIIEPEEMSHQGEVYDEAIAPVQNLVNHFGSQTIFVTRNLTSEVLELAESTGFSGAVGLPATGIETADFDLSIGYGIPGSALRDEDESLDSHLKAGRAFDFVSTSLQVPSDASLDRVSRLMNPP